MRLSQPAPNGAPLVVIRRDLLTELGCPVAAALLNAMQRWSAHVQGEWMQRTVEQWSEELLHVWSVSRVRRALSLLVRQNRIERRRNPRWKQTRTYQYRIVLPSPPPPPQQQQATRAALKLEPLRIPPLKLPNRIVETPKSSVETSESTLQVHKFDLSYNKEQHTDTTETEQNTQPVVVADEPESVRVVRLLIGAGLAQSTARDLCTTITEERARDVIAASADKRDPAGWIVAALRHNWSVPPRQQLPSLSDPPRYSSGLYADFLEQPPTDLPPPTTSAPLAAPSRPQPTPTGLWATISAQLKLQNRGDSPYFDRLQLVESDAGYQLVAPPHLAPLAERYVNKIAAMLRRMAAPTATLTLAP